MNYNPVTMPLWLLLLSFAAAMVGRAGYSIVVYACQMARARLSRLRREREELRVRAVRAVQ